MSLVYIGGVNGVGKTSTCKILSKKNRFIRSTSGTSELMKRLGIPLGNYDELRKLPEELKGKVFEEVLRSLAQANADKPFLVTGHFVKIIGGEITRSFGPWYKSCSILISLVAEPTSILRRVSDDERTGMRNERNLFDRNSTELERINLIRNAQKESISVMK